MVVKRAKTNIRAKIRWGIAGIFVLLIAVSAYVMPRYFNLGIDWANNNLKLGLPKISEKQINLGLDLQGGAHLTYNADVSKIGFSERGAAVEGVRDVIERRINGLGVSEPVIQTTKVADEYHIIVELPGITDIKTAIKMIGETPILEFKEQNNEPARSLTPDEKKQMDQYNNDAKKKINEVLNKVNSQNFTDLVTQYSEDEKTKNNGGYLDYVAKDSAYFELYNQLAGLKEGTVSKLVTSSEGYNILKRGKEKDGDKEFSASHILICYLGSKGCQDAKLTKEEAKKKAEDLFKEVNADNFAELAKQNSEDPGSKDNGGDLGYFTTKVMVKAFADAIEKAKVGEIIGPVESEFGFHVIYKKDERPTKLYEAWRILVRTKTETDILPPQQQWKDTGLSGQQLQRSEVVTDSQTGAVQVSVQFNSEGKDLFRALTERNVGKPVAIFLDGEPISIPNVNEPIRDGRAVISGSFDLTEAKLLSQRLNAGALPVPVELISQQNVGATLGIESLNTSLFAGLIGTLVVILFVILYYRLPGFLAVISLILYASLTLAITKLIGATLTLSGIAGFIMSIGMAVDANVLIFERMKEELKSGKSLKTAAEEGFLRAWTSIRDSNISTLISCVILIWFGSSFVKGFAMTLTIGVLVSMFTAITVTRTFVRFVVPWFKEKGNWMFLGHKNDEI